MYHPKPHINEKLLFYFHNKEMDELYLSILLKTLAESFVGVFVPIYLLTLWLSFRDIAIYYFIYYAVIACFMFLWMKLNTRIWLKKTMSLWIIISAIYLFTLQQIGAWSMLYYIPALIWGISVALYASSFHLEFSRFTDNKKEWTEFSLFKIFSHIPGIIWPFLWALFIEEISFNFLFLISIIIIILSIIPLFITKDTKQTSFKISLRGLIKSDTKEKGIVYMIDGLITTIGGVFWPIFIFITLKEVFSLGIIVSLTSLLMIVVLFVLWKITDKHKEKILKIGVTGHSLSWVGRLIFLSPVGIFLSNFYSWLTSLMIEIPFSKMIYSSSKKSKDTVNYFLFREMWLAIWRFIIIWILFFFNNIYWTFIFAFFSTFIYFLLLKKNPLKK